MKSQIVSRILIALTSVLLIAALGVLSLGATNTQSASYAHYAMWRST